MISGEKWSGADHPPTFTTWPRVGRLFFYDKVKTALKVGGYEDVDYIEKSLTD